MKAAVKPSDRIRVRRLPKRARYDWESIRAILDSAFLCHVGYVIGRQPFVTPTAYWRYVERFFPGRWPALRPVTRKELRATTVLELEIDEASAKVRTGPPIDDEDDYALPIWAGVVPIATMQLPAQADPRLATDVPEPAYLAALAHVGVGRPPRP